MSHFAERLVARSAGGPLAPGISMLSPRPASRFETPATLDIEATVDARRPVAGPVVTEAASPPGPAIRQGSTRGTEPPRPADEVLSAIPRPPEFGIEMSLDEAGMAAPLRDAEIRPAPQHDAGQTPRRHGVTDRVAVETAALPDGAANVRAGAGETPSTTLRPRGSVDLGTSDLGPQPRVEDASPPIASDRVRGVQIADAGQRTATAPAQTAMVRDVQASQPSAPTISIGKIEVQFLPQEPRVPALRSQPERTRGFAAFARARRGEPR